MTFSLFNLLVTIAYFDTKIQNFVVFATFTKFGIFYDFWNKFPQIWYFRSKAEKINNTIKINYVKTLIFSKQF